jgi:hypothetical protein
MGFVWCPVFRPLARKIFFLCQVPYSRDAILFSPVWSKLFGLVKKETVFFDGIYRGHLSMALLAGI